MEEIQTIRISVRNLVEFILREGDIDNRTSGEAWKKMQCSGKPSASKDSEADGKRISGRGPFEIFISV